MWDEYVFMQRIGVKQHDSLHGKRAFNSYQHCDIRVLVRVMNVFGLQDLIWKYIESMMMMIMMMAAIQKLVSQIST